ncbi:FadR/GntR family transcriptional regulator [Mycobacterium sp. 236(2023)]|uniref:FadR/GntR family transcriptional regulator n=1 Tax=Mycobacterium sp. 236(2023) TaxID=3038163 RepID=UPI002415444E|nr:FadR/GntR family transcriptional regulator [Mycobacterium sp. 236(2023)]MDG4662985.1 FadR/GntR family transcriptional regulator [Mycobacterium sp. 236(2023)]
MGDQFARIVQAPREPLSSEVARALLDAVFSGQITPGTRMPSERQLAESFGVGRFVVREALKSLGLLGLLEVRQGDGTYVRPPDSSLLPRVVEWGLLVGEQRTSDLVETRQHLEPVTARLAAERRSDADLTAIKSHLDGMRDASDNDVFVDADVAFHLSIAEATGNRVLSNMLSSIASLLNVWIRNVVEAAASREPSYLEHVPIYDAIAERDAHAAGEAMRIHMDGAACRLNAAIAAHNKSGADR